VKLPVQFTPELTVAVLCAAGWFGFWLLAPHPAPPRQPVVSAPPEVIRLVADTEALNKLKAPTLFALPSAEGFSGQFLENRIELPLSLEKPASPIRYLPQESPVSPGLNETRLMDETSMPQSALPLPGVATRAPVPPPAEVRLFLSPELKARAGETPAIRIFSPELPETVRVNLTVREDGLVESAFFDTPVTNVALLSAVRRLRFNPAAEKTEGRIDIRFPQEGLNHAD
jgi:hypothetical protein